MINEGIKFLYDNENLNSTPVINHLYMNIYRVSWIIREAELIMDTNEKLISVYVRLNWLRIFKFLKKKIFLRIIDGVQGVLPNFAVRVTANYQAWAKEVEKAKEKAKEPEKVSEIFNLVEKE
jgi:hypothetical protein